MPPSLPLPILLLVETIVMLSIVLFFMVLYILKQKTFLKILLQKLREIKETNNTQPININKTNIIKNPQDITNYFLRNIEDSRQRYEKYSHVTPPKIEVTQAYTAKVAALRFLYLTAEMEVYNERGITHAGWNLFERKLADIARWFTKPTTHRQDVRNNRTRILQERIDVLKPFEIENKKLQSHLEHAKNRQEKLEADLRENKATIRKLQSILSTLQQITPNNSSPATQPIKTMTSEEYLTLSNEQMDTIGNASNEKSLMLTNMMLEISQHKADMNAAARKKLDASLKLMETEIIKSDQYINNLKKELKEAKLQATNYALMLSEKKDLSIMKNGRSEYDHNTAPIKTSAQPPDYLDHEKIYHEISQLRENNKAQCSIISDLKHEISILKESLTNTDDETRKEKEQEVNRLERIVQECQGCIEVLESEVDHLYAQLQERENPLSPPVITEDIEEEKDIARLNVELDEMTKEMEKIVFQYRQIHSINQFICALLDCTTINDITQHLIQFIAEFNAPAGFLIRSIAGNTEYFPAHLFNHNMKELARSFSFQDPIHYLNEGTLFSREKICMLLLPNTDNTKRLHESNLSELVGTINHHICHLESGNQLIQHFNGINSWIESTKNHLTDLDIQYAYQVEENKKMFNQFISTLRKSYHLMDLQGDGLILLDNAINEYEERMYLLLRSGDIIDREISTLITHIDELQTLQ